MITADTVAVDGGEGMERSLEPGKLADLALLGGEEVFSRRTVGA